MTLACNGPLCSHYELQYCERACQHCLALDREECSTPEKAGKLLKDQAVFLQFSGISIDGMRIASFPAF